MTNLGPIGPLPGTRDLIERTRRGRAGDTEAGGAGLRPDQFDRYSRQLLPQILGMAGQERLLAARVLVIGAGGLGSPVLQYLAAAGVGHLTVVDDDVVARSNLHRQVIHRDADAADPAAPEWGRTVDCAAGEDLVDDAETGAPAAPAPRRGVAKSDSAVRMVRDLNPDVEVAGLRRRVGPENVADLVGRHDLVVDGTDNFPTRYLVADACAAAGVPLIWGSVLGYDAQVSVFWSRPPAGLADGARTLRDLFPAPPAPGEVSSCAEAGVVGALVGIAGSFMAMEAVKVLTGRGRPLMGRVLVVDALEGETRTLPFAARGRRGASGEAVPVPVRGAAAGAARAAEETGDAGIGAGPVEGDRPDGLTVPEAVELLASHPGTVVLDVREDRECAQGVIAGAVRIPLARVLDGSGLSVLDPRAPTLVYCAAGVRSEVALAALRARGWADATHLLGGVRAWESAGRALVDPGR